MITDPRHLRENAKKFRAWLDVNSDSEDDDSRIIRETFRTRG